MLISQMIPEFRGVCELWYQWRSRRMVVRQERCWFGLPGWYEVCEWHGWHGDAKTSYDEATNVPFEIGVGTEVRIRGTIDQQVNIGQWNRLGYINLPAGKEGYVKITNNANGYVIADAMRFRYMGGEEFVPDSVPPASPTNVRVY